MGSKRRRNNVDQNSFGTAVRSRRQHLGFSQEALADRARLHRTYIGSVERGERNVSLKNMVAIASALRMSASELLGEAEILAESE